MTDTNDLQARSMSLGERALSCGLRMLPIKHGKHRALDRLCRRAWKRDRMLVWVPFSGRRLLISVDELVGWHFAILRSFDPEVIEVLLAAGRDLGDTVFWDIGANKGACSYAIAADLPRVQIVAIEPQVGLEKDLKYNLQQLCPDRHLLIRAGIGDRDEMLELAISEENTGRASLHLSGYEEGMRIELIEVIRAQRVAEESGWGWPALVKIDVEGHESVVIGSMREAFKGREIKALVFECHKHDRTQFEDIREVVDGLGYSMYGISKSISMTNLIRVEKHESGIMDYAIILDEFMEKSKLLSSLVRK